MTIDAPIQSQRLATAQAAVLTSLITLYKALGGGWEPAAGDTAQSSNEGSPS